MKKYSKLLIGSLIATSLGVSCAPNPPNNPQNPSPDGPTPVASIATPPLSNPLTPGPKEPLNTNLTPGPKPPVNASFTPGPKPPIKTSFSGRILIPSGFTTQAEGSQTFMVSILTTDNQELGKTVSTASGEYTINNIEVPVEVNLNFKAISNTNSNLTLEAFKLISGTPETSQQDLSARTTAVSALIKSLTPTEQATTDPNSFENNPQLKTLVDALESKIIEAINAKLNEVLAEVQSVKDELAKVKEQLNQALANQNQNAQPTPTPKPPVDANPTPAPTASATPTPVATGTPTSTPTATPTPVPDDVITFAGNGKIGLDNDKALNSSFNNPEGIAITSDQTIYIADKQNHCIRKIDPSGNVSIYAGTGVAGFANGAGASAQFNKPTDVAVDVDGRVYVADSENHIIRLIQNNGNVITLAGQTTGGYTDAQGGSAQFNLPYGLAIDNVTKNLYVADLDNHRIRKIDVNRNVTTIAGGDAGFADGAGASAQFREPHGLLFNNGSLYVSDTINHRIRVIDSSNNVTTLAGSTAGVADGQGASAQFNIPIRLVKDTSGNLYVSDRDNHRIRKIDGSGNVTTLIGAGGSGFEDGALVDVRLTDPTGLVFNSAGQLLIVDQSNQRIRLWKP